jgi:predicted O-methyltransferase YrrM
MFDDLRVVLSATLDAYQVARREVLSLSMPLLRLGPQVPYRPQGRDYVVFHTWRPGWLEVDAADASALLEGSPGPELAAALAARGWTQPGEVDLDAVVSRATSDFPALQNPTELRRFLDVVRARRPRVVVEIGTAAGGLFYSLARVAAPDATLVAVDLFPTQREDAVCDLLPAFAARTQSVHVLRRSSLARSTRDELRAILPGPIDLLIVDGDHTYGGTKSDFEMYSPLVGPGGLVAMHDITVFPHNSGQDFETGVFWDELAASRETTTIVDEDGVPGIRSQLHLPDASRRRAAFGFGLVPIA